MYYSCNNGGSIFTVNRVKPRRTFRLAVGLQTVNRDTPTFRQVLTLRWLWTVVIQWIIPWHDSLSDIDVEGKMMLSLEHIQVTETCNNTRHRNSRQESSQLVVNPQNTRV